MNTYDPNYIPTKSFYRIGQKAIISNEKNEILLLQRSDKAGAGGKWALAGGALEDTEDPIDGIKREIKEETELEVSNIKPFHLFSYTNDQDAIVIIGYYSKVTSENMVLNWEHDDFKWVTPEEALKQDLTEHAVKLITQYMGNNSL
jgi:mutator protein MutT